MQAETGSQGYRNSFARSLSCEARFSARERNGQGLLMFVPITGSEIRPRAACGPKSALSRRPSSLGKCSAPPSNHLRYPTSALCPNRTDQGSRRIAVSVGVALNLVMLFGRQRLLLTLLDAGGEPVGHKQEPVLIRVKTCLTVSRRVGTSGDCCCWARARKPCLQRE